MRWKEYKYYQKAMCDETINFKMKLMGIGNIQVEFFKEMINIKSRMAKFEES